MRSYIKTHHPEAWEHLVKLRGSDAARAIGTFPNAMYGRALRRIQAPYFFADISGVMGLGAILSMAVQILDHCDRLGTVPYLRFTSPNYAPAAGGHADWLCQHFERRSEAFAANTARFLSVRNQWDLGKTFFHADLSIERANKLFHEHLAVRDEIVESVNAFCNGLPESTLGVHYRGTDKSLEAPRVAWTQVLDIVQKYHIGSLSPVFVATDEPEFLDFMRQALGRSAIIDLDCQEIYTGQRPAHLTTGDPFMKAREALKTMLVLSRFKTCIRTPSHLSAWAQIFNPHQQVVMLDRPSGSSFRFPDRQIWEALQLRKPPRSA